jgi:cell wall-associated NlpC family hydrolase
MKKQLIFLGIVIFCLFLFYNHYSTHTSSRNISQDTLKSATNIITDTIKLKNTIEEVAVKDSLPQAINTGNISRDSIVNFAQTLIGTPYLYASTDPQNGFDCSGFITYVFNHYKIKVPRSSYEFGNVGTNISLAESKKGDLILFTGTDSSERKIGHMGIVLTNDSSKVTFIHSSSGKAHGVTISPLDKYYQGRFMKVIRVFRPL